MSRRIKATPALDFDAQHGKVTLLTLPRTGKNSNSGIAFCVRFEYVEAMLNQKLVEGHSLCFAFNVLSD